MAVDVCKNFGLAPYHLKLARQRHPTVRRLDHEDALQVAYLGLVKAANTYRHDRGTLGNYAGHVIAHELLDAAQTAGVVRVPKKLRKKAANNDARQAARNVQGLGSYDAPGPDDTPRADTAPLLVALGQLSDRQRQVLRWLFWDGLTLQAAADRLGLTRERVRQIQHEALTELRGLLGVTWEPKRR